MSTNPCQICGCTDLNLVDGFYYCVECGTQDINVRETVVEATLLADGTMAIASTRKITTFLKDAVEMSGEWHKWHAYNFILGSLSDELIALGAKPTVKKKVLWIWVRYIKKYQQKEQAEATQFEEKSLNEEEIEELNDRDTNKENIDKFNESECNETNKKQKTNLGKQQYDIHNVSKGMLLAILYVALNLDKSDIQLSHLFRFIREGRLSIYNCLKFVPKELSVKSIPHWQNFMVSTKQHSGRAIRAYAMTIFKRLDLGVPLVPDLNKIISNYIKELCLPNDFTELVWALVYLMPCDFVQGKSTPYCIYTPDYEAECMCYVLIAFKMCFGLDCNYDIKLSDAVDKINCEGDYLKAYKLGMYSEPTDRLFSFREWCTFIQFRNMILCRYYLPIARHLKLPTDVSVFMEHLEERTRRKNKLSDDVTMDILNKIPLDATNVIPKKEFPVTFTPMTTYTEVILKYINDPDLKLRISEDFGQYSLKYATRDLNLQESNIQSECLIKGVDVTNKIINPDIIGTLTPTIADSTVVLVRNCENKNWLRTKPPKVKHVTKVSGNMSDNSYDSDESGSIDDESSKDDSDKEDSDIIEEEDKGISIFDDDFKNLKIEEDKKYPTHVEEIHSFEFHNSNLYDSKANINDTLSELNIKDTFSESQEIIFNPKTFDREKSIQDLIEIACKKYKIPLPKENKDKCPTKRKAKPFENNEAEVIQPKKKRNTLLKRGEGAKITRGLIDAYYENINNDVLLNISDHVKSVVEIQEACNITNDAPDNQLEDIVLQSLHNGQTEKIDEIMNLNNNDENFRDDNDHSESILANNIQDVSMNDTTDDNDGVNDTEPKNDPKFDPKTHDIKQLYINFKDEIDLSEISNINDPEMFDIIDKKIAELHDFDKNDHQDVPENDNDKNADEGEPNDLSDFDDDGALLLEENQYCMRKKDESNLEYLVQNKEINRYGYWMRHYRSRIFTASNEIAHTFNAELAHNCPKSFVFVLRECAALIESSQFHLYRCFQSLEERLVCNLDTHD